MVKDGNRLREFEMNMRILRILRILLESAVLGGLFGNFRFLNGMWGSKIGRDKPDYGN